MMKSCSHHFTSNWQATAGQFGATTTAIRVPTLAHRKSLRPPIRQQAEKMVAYTTQTFSKGNLFVDSSFPRTLSRRTLECGRTFSHPHAPCIRPSPYSNPKGEIKSQASYTTEAPMAGEPTIHDIFESRTGTWQYVVADPSTLAAVIIDPVLDYDPVTQAVTTSSADSLLKLIKEKGYNVNMILETHIHADHLTAASYIQNLLVQEQGHRPPISIGKRTAQVQELFGRRYGIPAEEYEGVFDVFFDDDETFNIGKLTATAIYLPGHTSHHLGYKIGDNVFCGDSLFHVDIGTARCDFPGGSSTALFTSGRKLLSLPDHVKIWTGHDYPPEGRGTAAAWMSVQDHKQQNRHIKDGVTQEEFVALREERDAKLAEPKLLHQSLQINIRAGRLPKPAKSGDQLLHLPLKLRGLQW